MIALLNKIIEGLGALIVFFVDLLPTSPFNYVISLDNKWIQAINWFFPISSFVAHMQLFVSAVIIYYAYRVVLRWIKVAGQ